MSCQEYVGSAYCKACSGEVYAVLDTPSGEPTLDFLPHLGFATEAIVRVLEE